MRLFRLALLLVGGLAALLGLVWVGQGTGVFPYPASSFMIDQTPWAWRGLAVCVVGMAVFALGLRRR